MRKFAAALLVLFGLAVVLVGCSYSYTEIYGQIQDKREDKVSSLMMVGKVPMPTTRTDHYLKVEHRLDGELVEQELEVGESAYELCEVGDFIFREESGAITCGKESWR